MLSAIFEQTIGDDLISSRLNRTAAMRDAAMSIAAFGFFSSLLLRASPFRFSRGDGATTVLAPDHPGVGQRWKNA